MIVEEQSRETHVSMVGMLSSEERDRKHSHATLLILIGAVLLVFGLSITYAMYLYTYFNLLG